MSSIGSRIKNARKRVSMTQRQLAGKAFVSESYIAMIELNKRNPSTDVVIKIADILGVSPDKLLIGEQQDRNAELYDEWKALMNGRTPAEIENANKLVRQFFSSLDDLKEHERA